MEPYAHEDDNGNTLTISDAGSHAEIEIDAVDGEYRVYPEDICKITRRLYAACNLPAPVILDRPTVPEGGEWKPDGNGLLRVSRDRDRLTVRTTMDGGAAVLSPKAAREMAAVLAALADEAEAEPDPEEVAELAEAIRAELYADSSRVGLRPSESDMTAARIALRWMRGREARHA